MQYKTIFLLLILISPVYVSAQTFSVGLGGAYGDDIENFGINARAYINSKNHRFCIGPEFTYFLQDTRTVGDDREEVNLFEVNFNGHYIFEVTKKLGFYPLTGLNYSQEKEEVFHEGELEESKTLRKFGWNVGGGLHYIFSHRLISFVEYDRLIGELPQNTVTFGLFYTFGKGFKMGGHEEE